MSLLHASNTETRQRGNLLLLALLGLFCTVSTASGNGSLFYGPEVFTNNTEYVTSFAACLAAPLPETPISAAPSYSENAPGQSGNPFPHGLPETFSTPTLADMDNDGDLDMLSGDEKGNILYFQNTGSAASPSFLQITGEDNPFQADSIEAGKSAPGVVDIDGDQDFDLFVGDELGGFTFFENTGDASNPVFTESMNNPLAGVDIGNRNQPVFADVDGDGDPDMVSGEFNGALFYFENNGGSFTQQTGSSNPFSTIDGGVLSKPALGDIDADGDIDLVIGEQGGTLQYYENTGTATDPVFTKVTGVDNPFDGFIAGTESVPAIGDLTEGNGVDVVVGNIAGDYYYYVNADPLPVELTSFRAVLNRSDIELRWATASETNNAGFEVQQYISGSFQAVGWVDGAGTTADAQTYRYTVSDVAHGSHRFRLKQIDFDGAFAYSSESTVSRELEASHVLSAPYPNPFNPRATFTLTVARDQQVTVAVYDLQGKMVSLLHSGAMSGQEAHQFTIDGSHLASGKYLVRAVGEAFNSSRTVTLLK